MDALRFECVFTSIIVPFPDPVNGTDIAMTRLCLIAAKALAMYTHSNNLRKFYQICLFGRETYPELRVQTVECYTHLSVLCMPP